ncbi:MAG: hypothetical protein WAN32_10855, partial [Candidatus Acidiferrum sp.]
VQLRAALQGKLALKLRGVDKIVGMQLPAQLQEFLLERIHFNPQFARHLKEGEIIGVARQLLELAATLAKMNAECALVAVPANQRRIRRWHRLGHNSISDKFSPIRPEAQKKWLAGAAANHLSDSPFEFPRRN